jgi:hypothetical protein
LSVPDKLSVAVPPLTNMSGDLEQEYFADGVVENITTVLSCFPALFVIARTRSSHTRSAPRTCVVGAIAPKIEQAEIERAKLKNTDCLSAYDSYLRGRASFHQYAEAARLRLAGEIARLGPKLRSLNPRDGAPPG